MKCMQLNFTQNIAFYLHILQYVATALQRKGCQQKYFGQQYLLMGFFREQKKKKSLESIKAAPEQLYLSNIQ